VQRVEGSESVALADRFAGEIARAIAADFGQRRNLARWMRTELPRDHLLFTGSTTFPT
jgi:hypothetical protein